jgi:hypothetical protein
LGQCRAPRSLARRTEPVRRREALPSQQVVLAGQPPLLSPPPWTPCRRRVTRSAVVSAARAGRSPLRPLSGPPQSIRRRARRGARNAPGGCQPPLRPEPAPPASAQRPPSAARRHWRVAARGQRRTGSAPRGRRSARRACGPSYGCHERARRPALSLLRDHAPTRTGLRALIHRSAGRFRPTRNEE